MGSIADYMEDQEFGATKHDPSIATSYSAGQGDGARPRTRLPRKPNKMANIKLSKRRARGKSRKQRNFIAVKEAAASGNKYIYLDLGRTKGIFKVIGGKRKPRVKMIWSLSRKSVVIPSNPWLAPAVAATEPKMADIYAKSLRFQLRRRNLFKG